MIFVSMEQAEVPPQVSVVIVSHNCAPALRRCLAALEASRERQRFEVLVVDNASLDESPNLDAEFPNATFLRLPRYFGLVKALNIGMRTAKGDFYFFLAPEAEVPPETIPALTSSLEAHTEAAAACPLMVAPDGRPVPQFFELPTPETVAALARAGNWTASDPPDLEAESAAVAFPSLSALMVRSYFLKGLRYIDERYGQYWADAEIAAQIRRASKKILLFPGLRVVMHPRQEAELSPSARALFAADWALGAATFAGKHFGFAAGLRVRIAAALSALAGLQLRRLSYILSGQKLDGTQRVL